VALAEATGGGGVTDRERAIAYIEECRRIALNPVLVMRGES
jgi:hypothetical protein